MLDILDSNDDDSQDDVKNYYGSVLETKNDLQTTACCTAESLPKYVKEIIPLIHDEVQEKFYGCGSPMPMGVAGLNVLDLGCGTGRDCYVLSKLVGETGSVIGLDMTPEQLEVAKRHVDYHTAKFGYKKPNVEFRQGYIEDLEAAGIADDSVDLVISNCVLNLSPKKTQVFKEIFRVLRPGGQLYFSDVFSASRIPAELFEDQVLRGECLSGALYKEDFRRLLLSLGCPDYRIVNNRKLSIDNPAIERRIGMIDFFSITVRAFKLNTLEDRCEDYGQVATYLGTLAESPHRFLLDDHHLFHANKPMRVCGNTASMLAETAYAPHFNVQGDRSQHFGLFDCEPGGECAVSEPIGSPCC